VLRDVNQVAVLPLGAEPLPVISAKGTVRWDISEVIAAIGELYYPRDPNRRTFIDDETGVAQPTFRKEDALGFNVLRHACLHDCRRDHVVTGNTLRGGSPPLVLVVALLTAWLSLANSIKVATFNIHHGVGFD